MADNKRKQYVPSSLMQSVMRRGEDWSSQGAETDVDRKQKLREWEMAQAEAQKRGSRLGRGLLDMDLEGLGEGVLGAVAKVPGVEWGAQNLDSLLRSPIGRNITSVLDAIPPSADGDLDKLLIGGVGALAKVSRNAKKVVPGLEGLGGGFSRQAASKYDEVMKGLHESLQPQAAGVAGESERRIMSLSDAFGPSSKVEPFGPPPGVRTVDGRELQGAQRPASDPVRGNLVADMAEERSRTMSPQELELLEKVQRSHPDVGRAMQFMNGLEASKVLSSPEHISAVDRLLKALPNEAQLMSVMKVGAPKQGWYRASTQAIMDTFGDDAPRFASLLASLSPRVSVEANLMNALNVWVTWDKAGRPIDPNAIKQIMAASVQGSKTEKSVLHAWFPNSVSALTTPDGSIPKMTLSGPKVNSFYANLSDDVNKLTLDAWMANGYGLRNNIFSGSGKDLAKGNPGMTQVYAAVSGRTRAAANELGVHPSEAQEMEWSALMPWYEQSGKQKMDPREFVASGRLTPDLVAGTPDFSSLFKQGKYRDVLGDTRFGEAADRMPSFLWPQRKVDLTLDDQRNLHAVGGVLADLRGGRRRDSQALKLPVQGSRPDKAVVYASPETAPGAGTGSGMTPGVTPDINNLEHHDNVASGAFTDDFGHDILHRAMFPDGSMSVRKGTGYWKEPVTGETVSRQTTPRGVQVPLSWEGGQPGMRFRDKAVMAAVEQGRGAMTQQLGMGYTGIVPTEKGKAAMFPAEGRAPLERLRAGNAVDPSMYMVDSGAGVMATGSKRDIGREKRDALQTALHDPELKEKQQLGILGTNIGGYVDNSAFLKKPMGSGTLTREWMGKIAQLDPKDQIDASGAFQRSAQQLRPVYDRMKGGAQLRVDVTNLVKLLERDGFPAVLEGLKNGAFLPTAAALAYLGGLGRDGKSQPER